MRKSEIEQAIKNGESVWACDDFLHRVIPYKANEIAITGINTNMPAYELKDLFATKQQAEHYLHHANITRTETLPFLTWEEFKEIGQISFIGKDKKEYILKKDIIWSNNKYTLVDCLKIVNETDFTFSKYFDYTEANFYKAYDEAVRLFKGDSNVRF